MDIKGSKTEKNLYKTFAGESRARNKYTFYAEKARKEGYEFIADIFEETAENEKAHAREVFNKYLRRNNSTLENLKEASQGEEEEANNIYKDFEKAAREEGFLEIANFFKELQEVEENHQKRYEDMHKRLAKGEEFKKDREVKWQCMNCGYIHISREAPVVCPLCKYSRGYFQIYSENYK